MFVQTVKKRRQYNGKATWKEMTMQKFPNTRTFALTNSPRNQPEDGNVTVADGNFRLTYLTYAEN